MRWRVLARALLVHGLWTVGLGAEELPTLAEFSQRLTDAPVPEAPRGIAAARPSVEDRGVAGAPPPIEVKERLWTLDLAFDLVVDGNPAGVIASMPGGYVFTGPRGGRVAVCERMSDFKRTEPATAVVRDAFGVKIGEIARSPVGADGERAFGVRDAAGAAAGGTGEISFLEPEFSLRSPDGRLVADYKRVGWLGGAWSVFLAPGADARLALMLLVENAAEDFRESKRRHDPKRRRRGRHGP